MTTEIRSLVERVEKKIDSVGQDMIRVQRELEEMIDRLPQDHPKRARLIRMAKRVSQTKNKALSARDIAHHFKWDDGEHDG